jgi:ABC-type Zn uptake system ZnuABC Zn-binding protein ZnuA
VPATPGHVEELVQRMKETNTRVVLREVAYELPLAEAIAERTGARIATISPITGGLPGADTYVEFVDANLRAILAAAGGAGGG